MLGGARVLLTGATGRLGRCLAAELLRCGCELILVVRASSPDAGRERVRAALGAVDLRRVTVVCGEVTQAQLGLPLRTRMRLRASLDAVIHAAAATSFTSSLAEARRVNVGAAAHVLGLAAQAPQLQRAAHVSTAFVAGKRTGVVYESELDHGCGFQNAYQQSKYEAEQLLRHYRDVLPLVVLRPSVVLDGIEPAAPRTRSAFRFALELVKRGLLPALPGSGRTPVDLVTEADAARAIVRLAFLPDADGTYHVAGGDSSPTLGEIVEPFCAVRYLGVEQYRWEVSKWRREQPRLTALYDELESFIYELAYPKTFSTARTVRALGAPVTSEDILAVLLGERPVGRERIPVGARSS